MKNVSKSFFIQGNILPTGDVEVLADILTINDVKTEDSGMYQCTAMDDRGRSVRRTIQVVIMNSKDEATNMCSILESKNLLVLFLFCLVSNLAIID